MGTAEKWLVPTEVKSLEAHKKFRRAGDSEGQELEFSVGDFWRWAYSDLRENYLRGILAEFLVAKALGIELSVRSSWDDYDLTTSEGIRIEVKAGGYLQSWKQKELSKLVFGRLRGRAWSDVDGFASEKSVRADVFVFCVQTATSHDEYDALDIGQWELFVIPGGIIETRNTDTISLGVVKRLAPSVPFAKLNDAVRNAAGLNKC